jgi:hypothetical protein
MKLISQKRNKSSALWWKIIYRNKEFHNSSSK